MNHLASLIGKIFSSHSQYDLGETQWGNLHMEMHRNDYSKVNYDLLSNPTQKAPNPDNTAVSKAKPWDKRASRKGLHLPQLCLSPCTRPASNPSRTVS